MHHGLLYVVVSCFLVTKLLIHLMLLVMVDNRQSMVVVLLYEDLLQLTRDHSYHCCTLLLAMAASWGHQGQQNWCTEVEHHHQRVCQGRVIYCMSHRR